MRYILPLMTILALSTTLHAADNRSTYERVEHEADRGAGRIKDQPTYELDRMRQDRSNPTAAEELRRFDEEQRRRDLQRQSNEKEAPTPSKPFSLEPDHTQAVDEFEQSRATLTLRLLDLLHQRDQWLDLARQAGALDLRRDEIDSTYQRRLEQLLSQYLILPAEPSTQPTTAPAK